MGIIDKAIAKAKAEMQKAKDKYNSQIAVANQELEAAKATGVQADIELAEAKLKQLQFKKSTVGGNKRGLGGVVKKATEKVQGKSLEQTVKNKQNAAAKARKENLEFIERKRTRATESAEERKKTAKLYSSDPLGLLASGSKDTGIK